VLSQSGTSCLDRPGYLGIVPFTTITSLPPPYRPPAAAFIYNEWYLLEKYSQPGCSRRIWVEESTGNTPLGPIL
jgi:hypothetical protein